MSLFKRLFSPDRQETQLVYEATYYPNTNAYHQVVWSKELYLTKGYIEDHLVSASELSIPSHGLFNIKWLYNNVPTQEEWNKWSETKKFVVFLRISPLIKGSGRVALISRLLS